MPITTRLATQNDLPAIYAFVCALEDTAFPLTIFETYYYNNISNSNNIYLVAIHETEEVIGYMSCHGQLLLHHCGWVFEIQEMFVKEEARGKGIGKILLQALTEQISLRNCVSLEVTANIKRTETHDFYLSQGFVQTHKKFTR